MFTAGKNNQFIQRIFWLSYSDKLLTEAGILLEAGTESVELLLTSSGLRTYSRLSCCVPTGPPRPPKGRNFVLKLTFLSSLGNWNCNSCLAVWFLDILVNFDAWLLGVPWTFKTFINSSSSIIRSFLVCWSSDNLNSNSILRVRRFSSSDETGPGFWEARSIS